MGLVARKPVLGVSDKGSFKPVSSATQTSKKIEILLLASLDMILFNKRITNALISMRRLVCAFVVGKPPKTGFVALRPKLLLAKGVSSLMRRCGLAIVGILTFTHQIWGKQKR